MWCCVKASTSHKLITHSRGLSRMPRPRKIFLQKELSNTGKANVISRAQLDMTWSNDFMLSVKHTQKKKINETWQHYIKSFCALIFLFCLCTFVWGVESCSRGPGGAELARTMWESKKETAHVVFSLQFLLWLQKKLHLYRPFRMSTPSISADRLERTFCTSPQLNPWIPLRWSLQNQQCHGCETLEHPGLMCRIKIKSM